MRDLGCVDYFRVNCSGQLFLASSLFSCSFGPYHIRMAQAPKIDTPARWAWHDHSQATRRAHGAAYATYVGSWRKRFRVTKGERSIARYEDKPTGTVRHFCSSCGTPLYYERARSPHMVNIPRALLEGRTGRQPLYHIAIEQLQEWAYTGEPLVPLKGFPGVVWQRSKRKKAVQHEGMF
jgi:hypothetical protein